jgi:hypothetical protein
VLIHYCTDQTTTAATLLEKAIYQAQIAQSGQMQNVLIQFDHTQYYSPDQPLIALLALIHIKLDACAIPVMEGSIFVFTPEHLSALQSMPDSYQAIRDYCQLHSLPWLFMSDPWCLAPVYIPKPWGKEIWYTGIEVRGQAGVQAEGGNIPLPWLLELMSTQTGLVEKHQPILLKVLDPLADEVYGDLYFELHEEKQEVYVVTHVDPQAWPNGTGAIQLGFAAQKRQHYQTTEEFKRAYLAAVKEYELVRRLLDNRLDEKKIAHGVSPSHPVAASELISWINELSQADESKVLITKEAELRRVMNSFVADYPLTVGDVVTVPRLVPHALQHGVRVIEFQTPVYERKILSFAQKVLTQSHWDTEDALRLADMDFARLQPPERLNNDPQMLIERIVNFEDFEVLRIQLNGNYLLTRNDYSIIMIVHGALSLSAADKITFYEAGQALLIPTAKLNWSVSSSAPCIFLVASPH